MTLEKASSYDVFNGDADGICALHQLRLAEPRQARLVTGVKRDIRLLDRLAADEKIRGAEITVLDISLETNREALRVLLERGNRVFYLDHHFAGDIPDTANLKAEIDPGADVCTGLIADRLLGGRFRSWAVVAAFGDNLHQAARLAAEDLDLDEEQLSILREIGELFNYNGYGSSINDLHIPPQHLYEAVKPFRDPFVFYEESKELTLLKRGFRDDMDRAGAIAPFAESDSGRVFTFPSAPWARRVAGVFSNGKARELEAKAHALLVDKGDGTFVVSVRAPLADKRGAADLCRQFPTGGGREAAAGINALPADLVDAFLEAFRKAW